MRYTLKSLEHEGDLLNVYEYEISYSLACSTPENVIKALGMTNCIYFEITPIGKAIKIITAPLKQLLYFQRNFNYSKSVSELRQYLKSEIDFESKILLLNDIANVELKEFDEFLEKYFI